MGVWDSLAYKLGFAQEQNEFELLETEAGEPGFWSGPPKRGAEGTEPAPGGPGKRPQPTAYGRGPAGRVYRPDGRPEQEEALPSCLEEALARFRQDFRGDINRDLVIRRFRLGKKVDSAALFINGMADGTVVNDFILRQGMRPGCLEDTTPPYADYLMENVFAFHELCGEESIQRIKAGILDGKTAVLIDGEGKAILADTRGYEHRSVGQAENEKAVRGPQEGYTENMRTNITLLRRIIRREDLVCEMRPVGSGNQLQTAILYLEGTANASLVEEIKGRIGQIQTRDITAIGMLEQLTETHRLSPFPQVLATERPDRTASYLMQGYVAVLLEGSPYANIMPTTLWALMSTPEDVYSRQPQGNVVRVIRYLGAILSILLPGYFLSLALYHQGMLSTEVVSTVISSREMVFAPIGMELVFLLAVFQLIREAGLRVPGSIGQAIGIIGGLILGQAAVSANLASSVILIIVALSGLGNFCIPDYATQLSAAYIRMALVIAAWLGGLLGMACLVTVALGAMARLKSYGVPFLAPMAPKTYAKRPAILRGALRPHKRATDITNTHTWGGGN